MRRVRCCRRRRACRWRRPGRLARCSGWRCPRKKLGLGKAAATIKTVVARLDRAIEYAAASRSISNVSGILGRPVKPGDDSGVCFIHQGRPKAGTELAMTEERRLPGLQSFQPIAVRDQTAGAGDLDGAVAGHLDGVAPLAGLVGE